MLVYIVGMQETKDGEPTSEPYYFGYTTNQVWANKYYQTLVDKAKNDNGVTLVGDTYTASYENCYIISKISQEKFNIWQQQHGMLEEIVEWPGGVYMTNADYESYVDIISENYDSIMASLNDEVSLQMDQFSDAVITFAKYSTDKTFKHNVRTFKKLVKYLKAYFGDYERVLEKMDLAKMQRKL